MPSTHACAGGYTLLELLIVMTIAGILTGVAALSLGNPQHREAANEIKRLHTLLGMAGDEAVAQGLTLRLELSAHGYRFTRYNEADDNWLPLGDRAFRAHDLSAATSPEFPLTLMVEDKNIPLTDTFAPAALFMPDGETTAFTVSLEHFSLRADGVNPVSLYENARSS